MRACVSNRSFPESKSSSWSNRTSLYPSVNSKVLSTEKYAKRTKKNYRSCTPCFGTAHCCTPLGTNICLLKRTLLKWWRTHEVNEVVSFFFCSWYQTDMEGSPIVFSLFHSLFSSGKVAFWKGKNEILFPSNARDWPTLFSQRIQVFKRQEAVAMGFNDSLLSQYPVL